MTIHREGKGSIALTVLIFGSATAAVFIWSSLAWLQWGVAAFSFVIFVLVLQFFRLPKRNHKIDPKKLLCPADGKVVTIQEVYEDEILQTRCIQMSIFMSPLNVHVNRYPLAGEVIKSIYHKGKFLVAWHPKSSTLNERTTIVVHNKVWGNVLFRQIAGAVARRIVLYAKEGEVVKQGDEAGFIKFGSRVDVFLPLDAVILVEEGQVVKGGITHLAERPEAL